MASTVLAIRTERKDRVTMIAAAADRRADRSSGLPDSMLCCRSSDDDGAAGHPAATELLAPPPIAARENKPLNHDLQL